MLEHIEQSLIYTLILKYRLLGLRACLLFGASLLTVPLSTTRFFDLSPVKSKPSIDLTRAEFVVPERLGIRHFRSVQKYSAIYNVDFRLVLAVMENESQFDWDAVSPRGARGILQMMPATTREISSELNLSDPTQPVQHLEAGIYYLAKLYETFAAASADDRIRLTIAAYNAGPARLYDAQELATYLGEDAGDWSAVRQVLPFLSMRYSSLHRYVWTQNKPPHGYYGAWKETVQYVDRVMASYSRYLNPAS